MDDKKFIVLLLSWIFFGIGFYTYENAGLAVSFIPFAIAAAIRGDRDKVLSEKLKSQRIWQLSLLFYLLFILLIVLIFTEKASTMSGTGKALAFLFPIIIIAASNDLKTCGKNKS